MFLLAAPGVMAGLVPWLLTGWDARHPAQYWAVLRVVGALLIAAGAVVLVHGFVRFVVEGGGTPAPVAPTERLVVSGAYAYVRNPMYSAVAATIVGQALLLAQLSLGLYAAVFVAVTSAFAHWYEEPTLARRYGAEYDAYRRAVPAWLPRARPWRPDPPS